METQPEARIVLIGKTGQGKSTLGNQIMGVEKFKVRKTMISETSKIQKAQFAWPEDKELQVLLVDTPGLDYNRDIYADEIIENIEDYMKNLGQGFNVGLFCWEAKSSFSADDLDDLALIQELLDRAVIRHLWICVTQLDNFNDLKAQKLRETALNDLPKIFQENGFKFDKRNLLFPQSINFKESIMKPLLLKLKPPKARIVLMGKTGQGKSTLGNQIMGVDKFKVGETMVSETTDIMEVQFAWPEDKGLQVLLVDTPGLADNRRIKELSDDQIIQNIEEYMKNLGKGLNVGLFCWEAKSRFSADDLNELALIQDLLGKGVIRRLWICITQLDKLISTEAQKLINNAVNQLPLILQENGFEFDKTHILFPQKNTLKESMMKPLYKILETTQTSLYKPPVIEKPAAVYVHFMMNELDQEAKELTKKLGEVNNSMQRNILLRQLSQTEKTIEEIYKQRGYY